MLDRLLLAKREPRRHRQQAARVEPIRRLDLSEFGFVRGCLTQENLKVNACLRQGCPERHSNRVPRDLEASFEASDRRFL